MRENCLWRSSQEPSLSVLFSGTGLELYLWGAISVWLRKAARSQEGSGRGSCALHEAEHYQEAGNRNWNSSLLWQVPSLVWISTEIITHSHLQQGWAEATLQGKQFMLHHFILCHGDLKSSIKKHRLLVHLLLSFCSVVKGNSLWISILFLTRVGFWSSNTNKKLQHLCFKCCDSASNS